MAKSAPYATLERAALRDLATRTIADPTACAEHVEAARRVLLGTEVSAATLAGALSLVRVAELRNMMARWRDEDAGETSPTSVRLT